MTTEEWVHRSLSVMDRHGAILEHARWAAASQTINDLFVDAAIVEVPYAGVGLSAEPSEQREFVWVGLPLDLNEAIPDGELHLLSFGTMMEIIK